MKMKDEIASPKGGQGRAEAIRCRWQQGCSMVGSIARSIGTDVKFLCSWHDYILQHQESNNFNEFCEWVGMTQRWRGSLGDLWRDVGGGEGVIEEVIE